MIIVFYLVKTSTVSFTYLDQGREILSRISLPKSMKHSVEKERDRLIISVFDTMWHTDENSIEALPLDFYSCTG